MLSISFIIVGTILHVMTSAQWSPRLTEKPLPNCREGIWRISSSALSSDSAQKTSFLSMAFLGSRVLAAADTFADLNAPIRSPFRFLADGRPAVPPVGAASAVFPRLIAGDGDVTLLWGRDTNTAMRWPLNVTALWTATRSRKGIWSSPQRLIGGDQVLWDDLVVGGVAADRRGRVLAAVSTFGPDGPRLVVVSRRAGRWTTTAFPKTALITSSSATRIAGDSVAVAYSTSLETHVAITPDWGRTWSPFRPVPPASGDVAFVKVLGDSTGIQLFWAGAPTDGLRTNAILRVVSRDRGRTWTGVDSIMFPRAITRFRAIATACGPAVVADDFPQRDETGTVYFARLSNAGWLVERPFGAQSARILDAIADSEGRPVLAAVLHPSKYGSGAAVLARKRR